MSVAKNIKKYTEELPDTVDLVAISKTKPNEDIMEAYEVGQRIFGENKIQEMTDKWEALPKDIEWHMVGHVQRNKVKYMAPYVGLIHAVDSLKLLKEVNKQAKKHDRVIRCLLQIKIAEEDSKFGISAGEAEEILQSADYKAFENVAVVGLMGMATNTENDDKVAEEFDYLHSVFKDFRVKYPAIKELSMGMSGDYKIAVKHGSTMVRIGSSIFGARNYN
ncbi:YggS family pyridoxal phosphate-dependent enzyme [Zunongwangia sp. HGR-M22]|uniref:YggS family pyridoxal phosphate-dependent enzyme n=1 Tax=Zunongwangia sp. HGR-M22 TaxID=3015168 RepID=UPI0022DDF0AD|nr:YggS family pyridoxal phosphate-dependent enzyme [Zunongwangia sp. HGR-M22]WBL24947.1 YggS family pyridoxal phosphate-dependent enzyme [Zunongwangia sp. HGR-M22]